MSARRVETIIAQITPTKIVKFIPYLLYVLLERVQNPLPQNDKYVFKMYKREVHDLREPCQI